MPVMTTRWASPLRLCLPLCIFCQLLHTPQRLAGDVMDEEIADNMTPEKFSRHGELKVQRVHDSNARPAIDAFKLPLNIHPFGPTADMMKANQRAHRIIPLPRNPVYRNHVPPRGHLDDALRTILFENSHASVMRQDRGPSFGPRSQFEDALRRSRDHDLIARLHHATKRKSMAEFSGSVGACWPEIA